jgi:hypothetical protein
LHCSPFHPVELVINKVLASRDEPLDFMDILFVHANVVPRVRE